MKSAGPFAGAWRTSSAHAFEYLDACAAQLLFRVFIGFVEANRHKNAATLALNEK